MNLNSTIESTNLKEKLTPAYRKTSQHLMPVRRRATEKDKTVGYDVYPSWAIEGSIYHGYKELADWIILQKTVIIDGYIGNFWERIETELDEHFSTAAINVNWVRAADYLRSSQDIEAIVEPFLGARGDVWGSRCDLELSDLFRINELQALVPERNSEVNIIIGCGAALSGWKSPVIYVDLPKNELQFRMRAGSINNLGCSKPDIPAEMYKRFYFVDWVLLNRHKKNLISKITVIADAQWPEDINWAKAVDIYDGLDKMSRSAFRVRPWFEPGVWGGQWIREHIDGINQDVVNYAWSFELIVPENGIIFENNGFLLEISFDFLMFRNRQQVMGKHAARFGDEFPIRFDFLDTFDGANLSIQCHPHLSYIQEVFGETITQDETYYILDCKQNAGVYLGFQEDIDADAFKADLLRSQEDGTEVDITKHVQLHQANKHDLFLIPNGTVHSAGAGNLVLEISATPYIFTFKMYDWVRLDLDGKPRPINIDHAFKNLDFERKGEYVQSHLISKPIVIEKGVNWELVHLPTHQEHFYDVHRIDFDGTIAIKNGGSCHVMMLVEGAAVVVETADGNEHTYAYAETFVIPAAAESYRLTNLGNTRAKVIKAFLK